LHSSLLSATEITEIAEILATKTSATKGTKSTKQAPLHHASPFGGPPRAASRGEEAANTSRTRTNVTCVRGFLTARVGVLRTPTAERRFVIFVFFVATSSWPAQRNNPWTNAPGVT
jgi:hypothetical protein